MRAAIKQEMVFQAANLFSRRLVSVALRVAREQRFGVSRGDLGAGAAAHRQFRITCGEVSLVEEKCCMCMGRHADWRMALKKALEKLVAARCANDPLQPLIARFHERNGPGDEHPARGAVLNAARAALRDFVGELPRGIVVVRRRPPPGDLVAIHVFARPYHEIAANFSPIWGDHLPSRVL